jgi:hypothetical protein
MADQDKQLTEENLEDAATGAEESFLQLPAVERDEEESSEIQVGPADGLVAVASSTEGVPTPRGPPVDLSQAVLALTQNMAAFTVAVTTRLDRLEAQAPPAPAPSPPVPVTPPYVAPLAAQPIVESRHIKQTLFSYKLRKYGGKEGFGDISQWVHSTSQLVPMMSTKGEDGEPERISMVMQALEGQPRAVAENVFTKAARDQVQVTWKMILDELLLSFGDPDAERSARSRLNDLKQKPHEDVVTYLTRFDALAHRIGDLTEKDAVSRIEAGLREPYQSRVNKVYLQQKVSHPDFEFSPESLRTLLKRSQQLEPTTTNLSLNAVSGEPNNPGWRQQGQQSFPYRGRNRLSEEEKQRRYETGRCFRCNQDWKPGHKCAHTEKEQTPNEGGVQSPNQ